jgi:ABC-2 type transport system permease protein
MSRTHQNWVGLSTLVNKEVVRIIRIWPQTLIPPVITMSLYFVIFGSVIGSRVGKISGFNYMAYIAPGLIMMSIITNSYSNVVSSFFGAKFARHVEELLVSPMPLSLLLLGYMIGGMVRGLLNGALVTVVALFFTHLDPAEPWVVISVAILTSAIFSLAGFTNAIFAKKFDDISIVPTFVLTPLTYLGGVFYSIALLPPFWRDLSRINPIVYMVSAFRTGILGIRTMPLTMAYSFMVLFLLFLFAANWWLLKRGIGIRS